MSASAGATASVVESVAFLAAPAGINAAVAVRIWPATNVRQDPRKPPLQPTGLRELVTQIPWVVLLISIVQLAVFVFYSAQPTVQSQSNGINVFGLPAREKRSHVRMITNSASSSSSNNQTANVHRLSGGDDAEWWSYLSYALVHVNFVHLGINVALQLLVGLPLEVEQGGWRVLGVYVASVWGGAVAAVRWQPHQRLVGASAGVMGLLLSHVPHTVMNFHHLPYRYFRLLAIVVLCASDALDIGNLVATAGGGWPQQPTMIKKLLHNNMHNGQPVANSIVAHCGGAVAGLLSGAIIYAAGLEWKVVVCLIRALAVLLAIVTVWCVIYL